MRICCVCLAILLLAAPASSLANPVQVMTFTGLGPLSNPPIFEWTEDGMTAHGGALGCGYTSPCTAEAPLLTRAGTTPFAGSIEFSTGSRFAPVSIDVRPLGSGYCSDPEGCADFDDPIQYIWVTGFTAGAPVASLGLFRTPSADFETIALHDLFPDVDLLRVEVKTYFDLGLPGTCFPGHGCGSFFVDNVTLQASAAIPEPSLVLLLIVQSMLAVGVAMRRARPTSDSTSSP